MSAASALKDYDHPEHSTPVRVEDLQPDRGSVLCYNKDHLVGTFVDDNMEYDNECVIEDEVSHIGGMASNKSDVEGDSDDVEYIVPDLMHSPERLGNVYVTTDSSQSFPSSWPTLEILPGGVIKDADKFEDISQSSDLNKPAHNSNEMLYACTKCPQKYKKLINLSEHVKWHEELAKEENIPKTMLPNLNKAAYKSNDEMMYACAKCPRKYKKLLGLIKHVKWHEEQTKEENIPTTVLPNNIPTQVPSKGLQNDQILASSQGNVTAETEFVPLENEDQILVELEHLDDTQIGVKVENEFDDQFETTEEFPYELPVTNIVVLTKQERMDS